MKIKFLIGLLVVGILLISGCVETKKGETISCWTEDELGKTIITKDVTCDSDGDCTEESILSFCKPGYPNFLECIGPEFYCGEDGLCKQICAAP